MLKGIPAVISPLLLKTLAEMGHGDLLVIGDDFYPAATMTESGRVIDADGIGGPELLDAVLQLMPVDTDYTDCPIILMDMEEEQKTRQKEPEVWEIYRDIVNKRVEKGCGCVGTLERYAFYETAKKAFATVSSGERQPYGCVIIQKGVM